MSDDTKTMEMAAENEQITVKKVRKRTKKNSVEEQTESTSFNTYTPETEISVKSENVPMEKETVLKSGTVFDTKLTLLYNSSVAPKHFRGIKGRFYIWSSEIVNGRIRLTDSPSGVGRTERIIGWMKVPDLR